MRLLAIVVAVLLASSARSAGAGPWTKSAGQAYVKVSEALYLGKGAFLSSTGVVRNDIDNRILTTALYAEVGVWDQLQAQLYLPYTVARNSSSLGDFYSYGGGDLIAAVQWSSPFLSIPHAIRAELKLPLYAVHPPMSFAESRFPVAGDGQIDAAIWLSAGDSLPGLPIYVFAEIGHRIRSEAYVGLDPGRPYADSFLYAGQVGYTVYERIIVAANAGGVLPYEKDTLTKGYATAGASIYAPVWNGLALEANFDGTVWARNTPKGLSFGAGVSYAF